MVKETDRDTLGTDPPDRSEPSGRGVVNAGVDRFPGPVLAEDRRCRESRLLYM